MRPRRPSTSLRLPSEGKSPRIPKKARPLRRYRPSTFSRYADSRMKLVLLFVCLLPFARAADSGCVPVPKAVADFEERALLRTIAANPFDPAPRLVFADWLMERNDPRE